MAGGRHRELDAAAFEQAMAAADPALEILLLAQAIDGTFHQVVNLLFVEPSAWALVARAEFGRRGMDAGRCSFNADQTHGLVVPKLSQAGMRQDEATQPADGAPLSINAFFDNLLFVPAEAVCCDPDDGSAPSEIVDVHYQVIPGAGGRPLRDGPLRVAVAPVGFGPDDFEITTRSDGKRLYYRVTPRVPIEEVLTTLEELAGRDADIIVLPECTVRERDLPRVADVIARAASARDSRLQVALVGIAADPAPGDTHARNEVAVFGARGQLIARQSKLTRWNISGRQRRRFELESLPDETGTLVRIDEAAMLYEDIPWPKVLHVIDLPQLGRIVIHICADLYAIQPGAWVRRHLALDWSFTPLLDGGITTVPSDWVFERAREAARVGRAGVVAATSVSLTARQNRHHPTGYDGRPREDDCGVLLMLDGISSGLRGRLSGVPLGHSGRALVAEWNDGRWPHIHRAVAVRGAPGQVAFHVELQGAAATDTLSAWMAETSLPEERRRCTQVECTVVRLEVNQIEVTVPTALAAKLGLLRELVVVGTPAGRRRNRWTATVQLSEAAFPTGPPSPTP